MERQQSRARIGIIGAGVAGLAAAYDLTHQGHQVVIYEGLPVVGGLAAGFKASHWDWPLERFYHHLFQSDSDILNLAREIGAEVIFRRPITAMWYKGQGYAFDSPLRVLLFPHLSMVQKVRMGLAIAYLRYVSKNWQQFERLTADAWLSRWMGRAAYETVWQPLLVGKFGDHYKDVNLAWFWARVYKRSPALGYFVGGFQAFADRLAQRVCDQGGDIRLSVRVENLRPRPEGHGLTIRIGSGEETFDAVISTTAPGLMARLAPDLPETYLSRLRELRSMGAVVMTVALARPLTQGLYWVNLHKRDGFPFLALVEHTNYMDAEHYGGDHLVYLGDYLDPDHRYFQMTQDELLEAFLPVLPRFNPAFDRSWIKGVWLHRTTYAQPIPPVNYSSYIPPLETPITGLYFASMSQVYPWDRGTNYAVEIGRRAARQVIEYLRRQIDSREPSTAPVTVVP
ncbi:MAG: NAD(P)/FAD-dependent oxidoreductase [Anaerolineae bacterium]|nr:NAD(P)/FAD-dependent oxidoreductase [Anaerolineae bacterium]